MLLNWLNLGKNSPLQRFIISGIVASVIVTILLYVSIKLPQATIRDEYVHRKLISIIDEHDVIEIDDQEVLKFVVPLQDYKMSSDHSDERDDYYLLSLEETARVKDRNYDRQQYVRQFCTELNLTSIGTVIPQDFIINEDDDLIWCPVYQAASATWLRNFNIMAGVGAGDAAKVDYQNRIREYYPPPSQEELMEARSHIPAMLIVRDPFERLSMFYTENIENYSIDGPYAEMAESIVNKYRRSEEDVYDVDWPIFEEFIAYVLDEGENDDVLDKNIVPASAYCSPCNFEFDVIMKYETLEEDQKYLIQTYDLKNPAIEGYIHPIDKNYTSDTMGRIIRNHYSQLTQSDLLRLYKLYRYDFLLFDYSAAKYFFLAKDE